MEFEIMIRNGVLFDGSGAPPVKADVGICGDRVKAVGDLGAASARRDLDALGLAVCPGFIDSHTHSDLTCFLDAEYLEVASANVKQGVTTEVVGNCGFSPFPYLDSHRGDLERHVETILGRAPIRWCDLDGYATHVREAGIYANMATLIGHGSLRTGVLGPEDRPIRPYEMEAMALILEKAFDQGAAGFSSGLIYAPGLFSETDELIGLCRAVARYGRPYVTHIRGETYMVGDSIREAIRVGREAGIPVHISHHKVAGKANWGRTEETLHLIEAARHSGLDVTLDVYPYTAGSTVLYALLPPWVRKDGVPKLVERLADRNVRDRILNDFKNGLPGWENLQQAAGWDGIFVSNCPGRPEAEGRSIEELADEAGMSSGAYLFDLIIEEAGHATMILHMMSEADVGRVLAYGPTMIGSDGIPLPGKPHPRWAGSFSRVLGRYCRERRLLDFSTAIRKMTSLAAERFGLRDRGFVALDKIADLVVFDPSTVIDRATFGDPLLSPVGVKHVFVNGRPAVLDGALAGIKPGRVLSPKPL